MSALSPKTGEARASRTAAPIQAPAAAPARAPVQAAAAPAVDAGAIRAMTERIAYDLYEQRGREDGHDLEDWLAAERAAGERLARKE